MLAFKADFLRGERFGAGKHTLSADAKHHEIQHVGQLLIIAQPAFGNIGQAQQISAGGRRAHHVADTPAQFWQFGWGGNPLHAVTSGAMFNVVRFGKVWIGDCGQALHNSGRAQVILGSKRRGKRGKRCYYTGKRYPPHKVGLRRADHDRGGAVVFHAACTEAPDHVVVELWQIDLRFTVGVIAPALAASRLAAAIAIGNHVGLAVFRIDARPDPRYRRRFRTCRARMNAATAARAKRPVDSAIPPVIALGIVLGLGIAREGGFGLWRAIGFGCLGTADGQDRENGRGDKGNTKARDDAPP